MIERCRCGWLRPLIALTTVEGDAPPANVIPAYLCPKCGAFYVPDEIDHARAALLLQRLQRELAAACAPTKPQGSP